MEPMPMPKVELMGMLSKLHLLEDMIRLYNCCSRMEPMPMPKVELMGMLSKLRPPKDKIKLCKFLITSFVSLPRSTAPWPMNL
jgi:hypothetical protein